MTNETLLLTLRAETLSANLDRLRKNLAGIPDRRSVLNAIEEALRETQKGIRTVNSKIESAQFDLERVPAIEDSDTRADTVARLCVEMKEVVSSLVGIQACLTQTRGKIVNMVEKCFRVQSTAVASGIAEGLERQVGPVIAEVDAIAQELKKDSETDPKEDSKDFGGLWSRLRQATCDQTEPMFASYLEFLGGVALRDTGFDEEISDVADELLRTCTPTGAKPNFVAIPTRQKALAETFARIIRVTFPDWTIWALPSTALEFWKVVAQPSVTGTLNAALSKLPEFERKLVQSHSHEPLGDAYATYTMGPAYAYFAVGLLLDPESEEDHARARAIVAMLECMDAKESPLKPPYKKVRTQLLEAWNAARKQSEKEELHLNVDQPENADALDPNGAGIRILVRVFDRVLTNATSAPFVVDVWNEIVPWAKRLANGDSIEPPKGAELRHVLNAAWLARVDSDRGDEGALTKAVQGLRDAVRKKGR